MAQDNVELMRRAYRAFERGDLDTVYEILDPEVELSDHAELPDAGSYKGHAGVLEAVANQARVWDGWQMIIDRFVPVGEDKVVVLHRQTGRSKLTGLIMKAPYAHVWTMRRGRAVKLETYGSWEEGLRAAGVPAQESQPRA
ncbi:MAG TPA: nuclear transport factor 2 family protein [Thermoleophilaceae bacterium]|jgi:ketosteroid isomerase-like protein|nr:nuclear transport factor 2 family protein [Thermoleophilaceae bacterium]